MAADAGEPLPEALTRLATGDRLIARWAARIAVPLREGADLWQVLIALGLVSAREANGVSALSTADGLRVLTDGLLDPVPGERRIRSLPATFFLAAVWPGVLAIVFFSVATDSAFERIYRELQLALPAITEFVVNVGRHPWLSALAPPVIALAAAWVWSILGRIDGVRWVPLGFFPALHRERAALKVVESALCRTAPLPSFMEWVFGLNSQRRGRPAWVPDYQRWRWLSGGVLAPVQPDVDPTLQRVHLCEQAGLVDCDDHGPDWLAALRRQRLAYVQQVARYRPLVDGLTVVQAMVSIIAFTAMPYFMPLIRSGCCSCSQGVGW